MSDELNEQEAHVCRGCCGAEENEVTETKAEELEEGPGARPRRAVVHGALVDAGNS